MKVFSLKANEDWICDRFVSEWEKHNPEICTNNAHEADILWLVAGWAWNHVPIQLLKSKKVVTTMHHIDFEKFDISTHRQFLYRDSITDVYHVPCEKTMEQLRTITKKDIFVHPFWVNQNIWFEIPDKNAVRIETGLPLEKNLIGSFQRDTEGHDLKSPKLSKGPDIFCDIVESMHKQNPNTEVVLAGWRRQYVMNRLKSKNINFHYFELADFDLLNKLYNSLDLYLVSARCEGGPQSVPECAITKTPIISTDVGLAKRMLHDESIYNIGGDLGNPNVEVAYQKVQKYLMPYGFEPFKEFLSAL
tara:strand:- start:6544 stop:7455 length:912 start_codon:yes stop_codon:yes gene_type:complete